MTRVQWILVGGAIIVLVAIFIATTHYYGAPEAVLNVLVSSSTGLLGTIIAIGIGLSRLDNIIQTERRTERFGSLLKLWVPPSGSRDYVVVFGGKRTGDPADPEPRMTFPTAYAFAEISGALQDLFDKNVNIVLERYSNVVDFGSLLSKNVIFLGGNISLPRAHKILELTAAPVRHLADRRSIVKRSTIGGADEVMSARLRDDEVEDDVTIVTRIVNPLNKNLILIISGCYGVGTLGGSIAVTDVGLIEGSSFPSSASFAQTIVNVGGIQHGMIRRGHSVISIEPWVTHQVDEKTLIGTLRTLGDAHLPSPNR
jgi:hypothetical protein